MEFHGYFSNPHHALAVWCRSDGKIQGNFGENQLTRAEPYNIIFNCDELFINV